MDEVHVLNAATLFGKPKDKVTAEERDIAKRAFYIFSYTLSNSATELEKVEVMGMLINLHSRAIACHCECMGLNAENFAAVCNNSIPPHGEDVFNKNLQKWNLTNEKGEPTL